MIPAPRRATVGRRDERRDECNPDNDGEDCAPAEQDACGPENDGRRTAWMIHPDGSWARATGMEHDAPHVTQGGSQRLWDILDDLRGYWLSHGYFQLYGATALIEHDGTIRLRRGKWRGKITA